MADETKEWQRTKRSHFWMRLVGRRSVVVTSLLTIFFSTIVFWWDEIIAPLTRTERPRLVQWIATIPWYYRVFVGVSLVIALIGEAAFRHIQEQDNEIEELRSNLQRQHTEEKIQSVLGEFLADGADLRVDCIEAQFQLNAWVGRFSQWRQGVLDALGEFGLAADYALFQNADAMGDHPLAGAIDWQEQVREYDQILNSHLRALAGILRARPKMAFETKELHERERF